MNEPILLIDSNDPEITYLTLNRPEKRNALSIELIESLTSAINDASRELSRRVIVIRGKGSIFCAGLDLNEAADPELTHRSAEALSKMYEAILVSPLVTIAQAHGAALGGGAGLIAACDFAVASNDLRVGYPEVHRGLVAALVTVLLRRRYSDNIVRWLILLGKTLVVSEARGLVTRISPEPALKEATWNLAREAIKGAPGAIARSKRLLDVLSPRSIQEDLKIAMDFHLRARESEEAREGIAAFKEKRSPNWGPRPEGE